jgi:hypothetical protein
MVVSFIRFGTTVLEGRVTGHVFHYLFDFGDSWWHRIRVQKIYEEESDPKYIDVIKSVGKFPEPYPDYDDEW